MSSLVEVVTVEHAPAAYVVHVTLFKDVQNARFLHSQLLARNTDFEYAFVDASILASRAQLLAAVDRAVTASANAALRTANVHSETVFSLSPSGNIADAFRRFGISPTSTDVAVVKVSLPTTSQSLPLSAEISSHLKANVQGTAVPLTDENLAQATDWAKVCKYYKLNGVPGLEASKIEDQGKAQIKSLVLSGMALRGV